MKARMVRAKTLQQLRVGIKDNLPHYRSGNFEFLDLDPTQYHELNVDTDESALANLKSPVGEDLFEVENCLATFDYLKGLRLYDARDERLWVYLAHTKFLEHARSRWPIPADDDKAISHINTHFFAKANRQVERDNVASRLWWMAHLCTRVEGIPLGDALRAFLLRADVRANIVERPTVAQSSHVFSALLKTLIASAAGKSALFERAVFRRFMVELNSIGGFKLLDSLPESDLSLILQDIIGTKLGISAI